MLADRASSILPAGVPLAVVVAEDVPVTVPPLCTSALGVTATAIVVAADTRASAAPAVEAAAEMPRQTVDQILLLPGLRQLKSGAQLLQLGDGLRARGQTNQSKRELAISERPVERVVCQQPGRRRECGRTQAIHVCQGADGGYHQEARSSRARDLGLQINMLSLASCIIS